MAESRPRVREWSELGGKSLELLGKSREELKAYCAGLEEPAYRADQIYHWLYGEREFSPDGWSNLPAALREKLKREATITLPSVRQRYVSSDGSVRYLFGLGDRGEDFTTENPEGTEKKGGKRLGRGLLKPAVVEAVFMPSEGRQTICISTQAGCAVDCQFCLTAQLGLIRNLTAGEMVAQVLMPLKEMEEGQSAAPHGLEGERPASEGGPYNSKQLSGGLAARTNVVLMGQGEPLLNFESVMGALRILLDAEGVGLSPKHVTISTSGIVPGIERLGKEEVRPKLAISLNASCDEQRDALMPINKKYPLKALMEACQNYPLRNWEHLTFEYVMLGGVNDAADDARRVVRLLGPLTRVKVNLIPWNPGELPYKESSAETIEEFRRILLEKGVPAFVRYSRGRDVMAACGQLALKEVNGTGAGLTVLG
jgi:23S rRNA (adenine2503-C2)-methyltransferase